MCPFLFEVLQNGILSINIASNCLISLLLGITRQIDRDYFHCKMLDYVLNIFNCKKENAFFDNINCTNVATSLYHNQVLKTSAGTH